MVEEVKAVPDEELGGHPDPVGEPGPSGEDYQRTLKAPQSGRIVMHGTPTEIAKTIAFFLGDREIHCTVEWEVIA